VSRGIAAAVVAWLAVVAAGDAAAQITNVQGLIGDEVKEGVSGSVEATVEWRTGNVDLILMRGAAVGRYRHGDHLVFALVRGEYARTGEPLVTFVSRTFEHLRYRYQLRPWLTPEAFVQHESDAFRRLRVRAVAGAGPRVLVAARPRWNVHAGLAYMLEIEQLVDDGLEGAGDRTVSHRASSYLVGRLIVNDKVAAAETIYVQPRLDDPSDLRVLSELSLAVTLTTHLTFKTAFVVAHDSAPPPETERTDTALQSALAVSF
jgi:hypothetical protein